MDLEQEKRDAMKLPHKLLVKRFVQAVELKDRTKRIVLWDEILRRLEKVKHP